MTTKISHAEKAAKRQPPVVMRDVVMAVILRELQTRFGDYRLGYAWAILEPLSYVAIFMVIKIFIGRLAPAGVDFVVFLVVGIMPWLLFSHSISRCFDALKSNRRLFVYRFMVPFDIILGRVLLETFVFFITYAVLIAGLIWWGKEVSIDDPLGLLFICFLTAVLSLGLAIWASIFCGMYPDVQKFLRIPMRFLFFTSGVFYSIDKIPSEYQIYLVWNPVLHAIQLSRVEFFSALNETVASLEFLIYFSIGSLWLGLLSYRAYLQRYLAMST